MNKTTACATKDCARPVFTTKVIPLCKVCALEVTAAVLKDAAETEAAKSE
jgi:hypothetical protein